MKKRFSLFFCLALIGAAAGCGNNETADRTGNQTANVKDVLEAGMAEEESKTETAGQEPEAEENTDDVLRADKEGNEPSQESTAEERQSGVDEGAPEPEPVTETALSSTEGIDIDLTTLSSTMVYSEVFNMMADPGSYVGKTVKMDGMFSVFHDDIANVDYFACIVKDATACCSQGIEFVLAGDHVYPDDYPELGTDICVSGVFDMYEDGGYTYVTLRDAKLI